MPSCNGMDRGEPRGTVPHAKAGRLPPGLSSREHLTSGRGGKQMTAEATRAAGAAKDTTAGAASHDQDWHQIDWYTVQRNVRRLQVRIVKARQEGRHGKVKALQRLLTHSFSGKALAVRRVTENQGKRTPGVDGVTWNTPGQKATAIHALRQRGYRPQPLRRTYIPRPTARCVLWASRR
jgi:hypothetical protein